MEELRAEVGTLILFCRILCGQLSSGKIVVPFECVDMPEEKYIGKMRSFDGAVTREGRDNEAKMACKA